MQLDNFLVYLATIIVATILPGPSMLLALKDGLAVGVKKSFISCTGYLIANLMMAIISLVGLGAIIVASGFVFNIIKYIGAGYLIYLGIKIWSSDEFNLTGESSGKIYKKRSNMTLFWQGFIVAAGNPKGIVFFTALFPQFINIKNPTALDYMLIFIPMTVVAVGCFILYAACGSKLIKVFSNKTTAKLLNRTIAAIFVSVGVSFVVGDN
jgi:threonine/homoserine/homoserine lactone efflux protein